MARAKLGHFLAGTGARTAGQEICCAHAISCLRALSESDRTRAFGESRLILCLVVKGLSCQLAKLKCEGRGLDAWMHMRAGQRGIHDEEKARSLEGKRISKRGRQRDHRRVSEERKILG